MSWPPEGSTPPVPPRPTPAPKPRPQRPSPPTSPGETEGETRVKPQAKPTAPTPPQFQHDGIDPMRAALILGLPLLAAGITLLVLFASTTVWWIAAGVAAAGVTGGVVLRRSKRARRLLRRVPGAGRAASALRRTANGRFAQSPLGRVLRSRTGGLSGGRPGGSPDRPKTLGGRLRSMLPAWAGGARSKRPGDAGGPSSGGSPGGRRRTLLDRLKPGGGRRPGSSGGGSGGRPGKPGGSPLGGAKPKPGSLLRKASRKVGAKLLRIRPSGSSGGGGGSSKPTGKGKKKPPGDDSGPTDSTHKKDRGIRSLVADVADAITEPTAGMTKDGYSVTKVRSTRELTRPGTGPSWPKADPDEVKPGRKPIPPPPVRTALDPEWPADDPDDEPATRPADRSAPAPRPPERSLPPERDRDPPPSPPVSPPPHRETKREAPRITSTNTGGRPMSVSPNKYNDLITNASSRAQGWQAGADAFRRDSNDLNEKAKEHDRAADVFEQAGNLAAAEERRDDARKLRDDANTCLTYAAKMQEKANEEVPAA